MHEQNKLTIEPPETQSNCTKKAPEGANFKNGGIYASYIEPLMMTLKEQLADKSSSKLIYMLNQWQTRKVA